jgi:hypothetical protein
VGNSTEAIEAQHKRVLIHTLDHRFGSPTSWPGYHLAKATAALRARTLVSANVPRPPEENACGGQKIELQGDHRNRKFTACGGKLLGRPDVVRANEVMDFKSGSVVESGEEQGTNSTVRQLQIYGYLVHETLDAGFNVAYLSLLSVQVLGHQIRQGS